MSTETDLRAAIVADPDDDDLRLVYADWLEERGELDRAELIRVQIELAHADRGDPRYWVLRAESGRLEKRCAGLLRLHPEIAAGFRRGLVGYVACDAHIFIEQAPDLFRRYPLEAATIADFSGAAWQLEELPEVAELGRLRELSLGYGAALQRAVLRSPHLGALRGLELFMHGTRLDDVAEALPDGLESLGVRDSAVSAREIEPLARRSLRSLAVTYCQTGDPRLEPSPTLRRVDLSGNSLAPDLHKVFRTGTANLEELRLDDNHLSLSLELLCNRVGLGSISRLWLAGNAIDGALLAVLAPHLRRLTELDLSRNPIGDDGARVLARSGARLRYLDLDDTGLTDAGVDALLDSPLAESLVYLSTRNQ